MMTNSNNGKINYPTKKKIKMEKKFVNESVAKIVVFQEAAQDYLSGFKFLSKTGDVLL